MTGRRAAVVLLVVAGAATPLIAHAIGGSCWIYLPAHVPALLAGWRWGRCRGWQRASPPASRTCCGGDACTASRCCRSPPSSPATVWSPVSRGARSHYPQRLLALAVAMVAGRLMHLGVALPLGRDPSRLLRALFITPWPGMVFQLVVLAGAGAGCQRHRPRLRYQSPWPGRTAGVTSGARSDRATNADSSNIWDDSLMCVLRAAGADFDVDSFLATSSLVACAVFRRANCGC